MDAIPQVNASDPVGQAAQIYVLKKSMQIEQQSTADLLASVQPPAPSNPPNLGQNVDIKV